MSMVQIPADLFEDLVDTLNRVGCQFWACEGPDAPFEQMKTCIVCDLIVRIRMVAPAGAS